LFPNIGKEAPEQIHTRGRGHCLNACETIAVPRDCASACINSTNEPETTYFIHPFENCSNQSASGTFAPKKRHRSLYAHTDWRVPSLNTNLNDTDTIARENRHLID